MKLTHTFLGSTLALVVKCLNKYNHKLIFLTVFVYLAVSQNVSGQQWYSPSVEAGFTVQYNQTFTTWDNTKFYAQWDAVEPNVFTVADVSDGYLQFAWSEKRVLRSKSTYNTPYVFSAVLDWSAGTTNNGGIIVRAKPDANIDALQEPGNDWAKFNRTGIAFYPTSDGQNMTVQFSAADNGAGSTPQARINVPKPTGVTNLLTDKGTIRIEDLGASLYVFYGGALYIRIDLGSLSGGVYTSGTVYNSNMISLGTFTGMEIVSVGKVGIAQRVSNLRLDSVEIKTLPTWPEQYNQSFTSWDNTKFYNQWNSIDPNAFSANDITSGYLQFAWTSKRILYSKNAYASYILTSDMDWSAGSSRGGIVLRANSTNIDDVQAPATGDPGFNRQGIAVYPAEDGNSMTVQFSGTIGTITPVTRISIPKPVGVTNLRNRGTLTVEDFGTSIYVYYNGFPFIKIELGGLSGDTYTSGTVYNSSLGVAGTFSGMVVPITGKVAIAQRDASMRLYRVSLQSKKIKTQTISYNAIGDKIVSASPFSLSATATSGLPVTFRIISGPATISGNVVSITGLGMVVTAASVLGGSEYFPAETRQTFFVQSSTALNQPEPLKAYGESWVATDAIGRALPDYTECGNSRANKYVGVFYLLWHGDIPIAAPIKTFPEIMLENPGSPAFQYGVNNYWGEPENGFYHPSDPWSTRRNLQMLANAGVDFLYIDFTNGAFGGGDVESFMSVALDMHNKGIPVPKIAIFMAWVYNVSMPTVLDKIYSHPEYDPLLFKWQGKPLLLADSVKMATEWPLLDAGLKDHFTWRKTWAFDANQWNFLDTYPQDYASYEGIPEQMPVTKAQGAPMLNGNVGQGSSFQGGVAPVYNQLWETDQSKYGYQFEEQWSRAHQVDPSIVCITGWNELVAGQWISDAANPVKFMGKEWNDPSWRCVNQATCPHKDANGNHTPHGWHVVDQFNTEFNRDIEPMKGGYTDNYYYQLVSHIRKFKGVSAPEAVSPSKTISIDGNLSDWSDVTPLYKDAPGDVVNRNFKNVNNSAILTNNTARNDIIESKTTYDATNLYFYVKTVANITPYTDPNWMLLFIDVDKNKATGWEGYDYVVNLGVTSSTQTTLKQWNGSSWANPVTITYSLSGNQMELIIPRTAVGLINSTPKFYFHWADNPQQLNDITGFFTDGESAPDRRFNYDFTAPDGIINGCFESPVTTTYQYGTMTNGWTFDTKTGVQRNASGMGAPTAPEGVQTAFVNKNGVITQNVNFSAGSYKIGFFAAKKSGNTQTIKVYYDATLIGTITPASATAWTYYWSSAFTATAGAHTIKFVGTKTTDQTAFIDGVDIVLQTTLTNGGFETPVTTTFQYSPFTNGWTFLAEPYGQSGVQKNGSAWTAPTAPEGTQTAFLQAAGRIYQDFAFAAGSYKITFYAAYRSINTQTQSVNVYCDGILIGTITPASSSSFGFYSTNRFTVAAGTHRIMFANVNSLGDIFIDNVNLVLGGYKAPELLTKLEDTGNEITIYPNPALSQITLSNVQLNSQIYIFTLDGKKVYSFLKKDSEPLNILVNSWCKGVYLVHIHTDKGNIIKKVIVE